MLKVSSFLSVLLSSFIQRPKIAVSLFYQLFPLFCCIFRQPQAFAPAFVPLKKRAAPTGLKRSQGAFGNAACPQINCRHAKNVTRVYGYVPLDNSSTRLSRKASMTVHTSSFLGPVCEYNTETVIQS